MTTPEMLRRRRALETPPYEPYERKEFWYLEKPDLRPLLTALRHVPSDPMTRMAMTLGRGGALWTPQRREKKPG